MSIAELYEGQIKTLPPAERLQLATLILSGIGPESLVDWRTEWTDEDLRDASAYSLSYVDAALGDDHA